MKYNDLLHVEEFNSGRVKIYVIITDEINVIQVDRISDEFIRKDTFPVGSTEEARLMANPKFNTKKKSK